MTYFKWVSWYHWVERQGGQIPLCQLPRAEVGLEFVTPIGCPWARWLVWDIFWGVKKCGKPMNHDQCSRYLMFLSMYRDKKMCHVFHFHTRSKVRTFRPNANIFYNSHCLQKNAHNGARIGTTNKNLRRIWQCRDRAGVLLPISVCFLSLSADMLVTHMGPYQIDSKKERGSSPLYTTSMYIDTSTWTVPCSILAMFNSLMLGPHSNWAASDPAQDVSQLHIGQHLNGRHVSPKDHGLCAPNFCGLIWYYLVQPLDRVLKIPLKSM